MSTTVLNPIFDPWPVLLGVFCLILIIVLIAVFIAIFRILKWNKESAQRLESIEKFLKERK